MKRRCFAYIGLLLCLTLFSACQFSLPSLDLFQSDPIVCQVIQKDGQTLTVQVLSPDSHYDEEETLLVAYRPILGGNAVSPGDQITFSYLYNQDVTVKGDLPYITVESVTLTQWTPETAGATEN